MFKGFGVKKLRLGFVAASVAMLLSACSIPIGLGDLLPELGSNASGTFVIPNVSKSGFDMAPLLGDSQAQTLVVSSDGKTTISLDNLDLDGLNPVIDLTGQDEIQSQLVAVGLSYKIALTKIGEYSLQNVSLQPYLASADNSAIDDAANALGSAIAVTFVPSTQIVEANIDLNAMQVKAINERKLRLGFSLAGTVTNVSSGTVGVSYDIESFKIVDLKVDVNERFPAGSNGEVISIANIDTGIATVNSLTLDYEATLTQSTPTVLKGTATVELYLAETAETNLYQVDNLIKSIDVDISGAMLSGQLKIENPLVAAVLADNEVRYGVKITGTGVSIEAVPGNDTEVTFEYEVTKLTGTAGVGL